VLLLSDIIEKGIDPLALRLVFLENRYRSQMDLTWDSLYSANTTLKRWRKKLQEWGTSQISKSDDEFVSALMNDLDTPRAIQRLRLIEKDPSITNEMKRAIFVFSDQIFALDLIQEEILREMPLHIEKLLKEREMARAEKNWSRSDVLRDELEKEGLLVRDTGNGQEWDFI
jgi:cysteinyl-tRNA synthetase